MPTSASDVPVSTVSNTTTFSTSKNTPTSTNLPKRSFVTSSEESSEGDLTPTPGDDSKMRSPIHTTDEEAVLAVLETGKYASKKKRKNSKDDSQRKDNNEISMDASADETVNDTSKPEDEGKVTQFRIQVLHRRNVGNEKMSLKRKIIVRFLWSLQMMKMSIQLPNQRVRN